MSFLVAPVFAYSVSFLIGLLSFLFSNLAVLQTINFVFVFCLGFGGNYLISKLAKQNSLDLLSWQMLAIYAGIACAIWIICHFFSKKPDKNYEISHS